MAFNQLIEQRAASVTYVDDKNTRLRRNVAYGRNKWAQDPISRLWGDPKSYEIGSEKSIRSVSPNGNFDSKALNPEFDFYDDGFNVVRATKTISFEVLQDDTPVKLNLTRIDQRYTENGYGWRYSDLSGNQLDVLFIKARGKWVYRFTPIASGSYFANIEIALNEKTLPNSVSTKELAQLTPNGVKRLGQSCIIWHWGDFDELKFDWSDMIRTEIYANHTIRKNGIRVGSKRINWRLGDAPIVIDPTLPVDAGFSGSGDAGSGVMIPARFRVKFL
jgi:hypothetical protein